jgi:hypothetical protein
LLEKLLQQPALHTDEASAPLLVPNIKETHRANIWAYCSTSAANVNTVIYDFVETQAGVNARSFFDGWQGKLVCNDYSGYKAGFSSGITEIGFKAQARRKFYDLHLANKA